MRSSRPARVRWISALATLGLTAAMLGGVTSTASAAPAYTVKTLHFKVKIGPTGTQTCDIIGDLYLPKTASSKHRVPAILASNGFGGSKDDQAGIGKAFATRGYAVLSYSGLGFGGSTCKITLDDPDWDGKAASQLVSYLGGRSGIAFTDAKHTTAAPALHVVKLDSKNHAGKKVANDPRVGMVGGSYGGQNQFAAASVDPRIDTIVPIITWNDLSYSLGPNNTAKTTGVSSSTPGATKIVWGLLFSGLGIVDGVQHGADDPARLVPCPNFATFVCPALVYAGTTGTFDNKSIAALRHASVSSYMKKIKIPTLLVQGENDTLFNINEAVATYKALKAQGTKTKMIWQQWGHSDSTPAPGEIDLDNPNPATQYETARISAWFGHYLKGKSISTGPNFAYFRDWISYKGIATPAYGTSGTFPVGTARKYYLSAGKKLVTSSSSIAADTQSFVTPPAGLPSSLDPADVLGGYIPGPTLPEADLPGTSAAWTTPALTRSVDVAGSPVLKVKVAGSSASGGGPLGQLVLFVKVLDVDAKGGASVVRNLIAPVRIPDTSKPFTVTLPGIVHRFAAGHSIRVVIAGGSPNYRGGLVPTPVSVTTGGTGQVLTLPVVN